MDIYAVGSKNPAKLEAVRSVFTDVKTVDIIGVDVNSNVSAQPFSDEETMEGAISRAKGCLIDERVKVGFGLEGGVTETKAGLMLCNWGALMDRNGEMTVASGAKIILPDHLAVQVRAGKELGDVIDRFAKERDVRKKGGTVGILTNGLITRSMMFEHIVRLLVGQYEFQKQKS
ncbi:DUF84 family protein [Alkalihalobacterium elongatum]|uniref:DUF84 family protein n=1 Tax=Alkalihalobacterium elongatum TaxID=2675466 RepID=UPI001C1F3E12|nr:DUF84 family protein [Alkalihalobacterium elongatum]